MDFSPHEETQKMAAAKLAALLADEVKISPLVLDGKNREEKTAFVPRFIHFLKQHGAPYQTISIDLNESGGKRIDMMRFVSDLAQGLPEEERRHFFQAAEWLMRLATEENEMVENYLRRKSADSLATAMSETDVESLLQTHLQTQRNIRIIRTILEKYTADHPLLVFIDGLDTCTADFVIKVLKTIDIVLKVSNLQFILLADMGHLLESVATFYGPSVNPVAFLERMTGFRFKFGPPAIKDSDLLTEMS